MNVLAIGSSARLGGNSNALLHAAIDAARQRGVTVDVAYARHLMIQGCLGCDGCKRSPEATCVVKDDMHEIYRKIRECDALLLATPVYFYAMNSWLKAIIDRLYGLLDADGEPRIDRGKGLYVITTEEEEDTYTGREIVATLDRALGWFGMEMRGQLVAVGLHGPRDWESREEYVQAAAGLLV